MKYRIRMPEGVRAAVARVDLDGGNAAQLSTRTSNILGVALPYAKELLAGRYDPSQLQGGLLRTLLRFQGLAADLPDAAVADPPGPGDRASSRVHVRARAARPDERRTCAAAAVIAFLGLCACGFIVGAFIAFAPGAVDGPAACRCWGSWASPAAAALFGAAFTWYLFGGRFRKVSVRRWLKKRRVSIRHPQVF